MLSALTATVQQLADAQRQATQNQQFLQNYVVQQQQLQQQQQQLPHGNADGTRLGLKPKLPLFKGRLGVDSIAQFVADLETAFEATGVTSDRKRIYIAASCLEGTAKQWWFARTQLPGHNLDNVTWKDFIALLREQYLPTNYATTLRERLRYCKQRNSVHGYTTEFCSIAHQITTMSEDDKVFNYIQGLRQQTASWVLTGKPRSLQAAIDRAMEYDSAYFRDRTAGRQIRQDFIQSRDDGMEVDALNMNNGARAKGTGCYHCGQQGHFKRNCPALSKNNTSRQPVPPRMTTFRPFGNGQ